MKECHYLGLCRDESPPLLALQLFTSEPFRYFQCDFYFKVKRFFKKGEDATNKDYLQPAGTSGSNQMSMLG